MARGTNRERSRSRSRSGRNWRQRNVPVMPRVLVTGATGCLGAAVVRELADNGYPVTALDLPGGDFSTIDVARVKHRPGDIRDRALLGELVREAEIVVNLASVMDEDRPPTDLEQVNVHAVIDLYEKCTSSGVQQLVQLSTGAMYPSRPGPLSEDISPVPFNGFERTKLAADEFLLRRSTGESMPVTIIRPAVLVGPGRRPHVASLAAVPAILAELTSRVPRLVGGPRISWVHVQDVARAVLVLLTRDPLRTGIFNVATTPDVTLGEVLDVLTGTAEMDAASVEVPYPSGMLGVMQPLLHHGVPWVDAGLRRGFAHLIRGHGLRDALRPGLGRTALRRATEERVLDTTRLEALGFEPLHTDLAAAWGETVHWYRDNRWLP